MSYNTDILKPYKGLPKEIYILFISKVVVAIGAFVYPMLTLLFTKKIGLDESAAGNWISFIGLAYLPASLIGGKICDTFGRKRILVVCDLLAAACYVVCGFMEPSVNMIYMICMGIFFFGLADPAHSSIVADVTTPENRDGAFSLTYLGFNIGFAVGPIIGGLLFEDHLRWFFLGDAITTAFATILIAIFVKETIHHSEDEVDETRVMEKKAEGSIISVVLQRPQILIFAVVLFGYNFAYSMWGFLMPLHVESVYTGQGASIFGKLSALNGLVVMMFTPILTKLLIHKAHIRKMVYGGIMYLIGFSILGFVNYIAAFIASVFLFTLGEIICAISSMPYINNNTPVSHRGRMNALLPLLFGAGYSVGPLVMGSILERTSISYTWHVISAVLVVSVICMMILEWFSSTKIIREREKGRVEA
ncbi:MAG: MFS transporter [Clostridia bacterium]|nr:MFS transporter [Clostridia bacterium]